MTDKFSKSRKLLTLAKEASTFTLWPGTVQHEDQRFWSDLFHHTFLEGDRHKNNEDDMIYFVNRNDKDEKFFVRRRSLPDTIPNRNSRDVHWENSYFLNVLMHSLVFQLTVLVCYNETEDTSLDYSIVSRVTKQVFASPSKVRMDKRGKDSEILQSYPRIFFTVEGFDAIWKDIKLSREGEFVAVDLCCNGNFFGLPMKNVTVFRGGLGYVISRKGFLEGKPQWYSGIVPRKNPLSNVQERFLEIKGPRGSGKVQIAFTRIEGNANENENRNRKDKEEPESGTSPSLGKRFLGLLSTSPVDRPLSGSNEKLILQCSPCYISVNWQSIFHDLFSKTKYVMGD